MEASNDAIRNAKLCSNIFRKSKSENQAKAEWANCQMALKKVLMIGKRAQVFSNFLSNRLEVACVRTRFQVAHTRTQLSVFNGLIWFLLPPKRKWKSLFKAKFKKRVNRLSFALPLSLSFSVLEKARFDTLATNKQWSRQFHRYR